MDKSLLKMELEHFAMWLKFEQLQESIRNEAPKLSVEYVQKYMEERMKDLEVR